MGSHASVDPRWASRERPLGSPAGDRGADGRALRATARARRGLCGVVLALALPVVAPAGTHEPPRIAELLDAFHNQHEKILVVAHRGAHQRYPENSLPAIEEAIRLGVHIVELDVRKSADGHLVLMHDAEVDRTTTGTGSVSRLTLQELKAVRLRRNDSQVTEYRVPTLDEALRLTKDRIMVNLDPKVITLTDLLRVIDETKTARQVLVSSSSSVLLVLIHWFNPEVMVMPRARSAASLDRILRWMETRIIQVDESFYTRDTVEKMRRANKRIWINTLGPPDGRALKGDTAGYRRIVSGGANVLQTNNPEVLLPYLQNTHRVRFETPRRLRTRRGLGDVVR